MRTVGVFRWVCLGILAVGCGGCLQSANVDVRQDEEVHTADRLLRIYHLTARSGEFAAAWSAHEQLASHVLRNGLGEWLMDNYCPTNDCADIGYVAWNLGKTKADMESMGQWGCADSWTQDFCAELEHWVDVRKAYLSEAPTPPNHPPREVDLSFLHAKDRPWTVVKLGDTPLWGMLDTGAYAITFQSDQDGLTGAFMPIGKPYAYTSPWGAQDVHQSVVLGQFTLGSLVEKQVPAVAIDDANDGYRDMAIVGTNVLFRYPQICFDWANSTLHLGRLGPCGQGVELDEVGLRSGMSPVVRVRASDGGSFDVLLDTGADRTLCQDRFVQRMGEKSFQFGSHPEFRALCVTDSEFKLRPLSPEDERFDLPALIGMDTLMKFDGFGWELNPFRVYLVPKSES